MSRYRYRASKPDGSVQEGSLHAFSLQSAREAVRTMGMEPIEITEAPRDQTGLVGKKLSEEAPVASEPKSPAARATYFPLLDTLRIYAGWLLAWYSLVYIIGYYQFSKDVPVNVPYAESLFLSPLVLSFTFAAYLFLIGTGLYRYFGKTKKTAAIILAACLVIFYLYRINIL